MNILTQRLFVYISFIASYKDGINLGKISNQMQTTEGYVNTKKEHQSKALVFKW